MSLEDMQTAMADLKIYLDDLKDREVNNLKAELQLNIVPLLQGFMTSTIIDSEEQWGTIQELIETTEDVIHPELAGLIIGTLEIGGGICQILKSTDVKIENDLIKKKLDKLMLEYQRSAVLAIQRVAEVTIDTDDEETDDGTNDPDPGQEVSTQEASEAEVQPIGQEAGDGAGAFAGGGDELGDGAGRSGSGAPSSGS
jgi:hypothetical protein